MIPADQKPYDQILIVRRDSPSDANTIVARKTLEAALAELVSAQRKRGLWARIRDLLDPVGPVNRSPSGTKVTARVWLRHGMATHQATLITETCGFAHVKMLVIVPTPIGEARVGVKWVDPACWHMMPDPADPHGTMAEIVMLAMKALDTNSDEKDLRIVRGLGQIDPRNGGIRHVASPFGPAVHLEDGILISIHSRIQIKAMNLTISWKSDHSPEVILGPVSLDPCEDAMETMRAAIAAREAVAKLPDPEFR